MRSPTDRTRSLAPRPTFRARRAARKARAIENDRAHELALEHAPRAWRAADLATRAASIMALVVWIASVGTMLAAPGNFIVSMAAGSSFILLITAGVAHAIIRRHVQHAFLHAAANDTDRERGGREA